MEQHMGAEKTDQIFYDAGKLAGVAFYQNFFSKLKTSTIS